MKFIALLMTAAVMVAGTTVGRAADARVCSYLTDEADFWRRQTDRDLEEGRVAALDLGYMHLYVITSVAQDACGEALYPEWQAVAREYLLLRLKR